MDGADGVYPSAEDTFLLIDALVADAKLLREVTSDSGTCIEIGCGSGEVSQALASLLPACICMSTDVNVLAAEKTHRFLADQKRPNTDVLLCDMFSAFRPGVTFDVIVFNPPYVPTDKEELDRALSTRDISASWAGGRDGREVMDKFLENITPFLSKHGVAYLVALEFNDPTQLETNARLLGLSATTVMKRRAGIEQLYILRLQNLS